MKVARQWPQSHKVTKKKTIYRGLKCSSLQSPNSPICATVPKRCPIVSQRPPLISSHPRFFSLSPFGASIRRQACRSVANNFLSFFAFVKGPEKPRISSESLYCMTFFVSSVKRELSILRPDAIVSKLFIYTRSRSISFTFQCRVLTKFMSVISKREWRTYSVIIHLGPPFWV